MGRQGLAVLKAPRPARGRDAAPVPGLADAAPRGVRGDAGVRHRRAAARGRARARAHERRDDRPALAREHRPRPGGRRAPAAQLRRPVRDRIRVRPRAAGDRDGVRRRARAHRALRARESRSRCSAAWRTTSSRRPRTRSRKCTSWSRSSTARPRPRRPVRALLCPASLKGVLTAREAAAALGRGARERRGRGGRAPDRRRGRRDCGCASRRRSAASGARRSCPTRSADRSPRAGSSSPDGRAVIEAAAAIGLPLLTPEERDPLVASSRGLGELALAASREAPRELLVGLGGSATVDGGAGLREVLRELPVRTIVLCDVRTTLADAARLFGPQKGASAGGRRRARAAARGDGGARAVRRPPGRGCRRRSRSGVRRAGRRARRRCVGRPRPRRLRRATSRVRPGSDGRRVRSTRRRREGKAPGVVAERCAAAGVRCVVFGGRVVRAARRRGDGRALRRSRGGRADLEALGRRLVA